MLNCAEVRSLTSQFLDLHYKYRRFDERLSERTYELIFETMDPARNYFLKADLEKFEELKANIPNKLKAEDCGYIDDIHKTYLSRLSEVEAFISQTIAGSFDFEKDEKMYVGEPVWHQTVEARNTHWRQRIKFQLSNMMATDSLEKAKARLKKRYALFAETERTKSSDEIYDKFLNAFAGALDPHSAFMLPAAQEDFNIGMGNQLEGIGATLRSEDGYITVQRVVPGGAADRDGRLQAEDMIIGVNSPEEEGMIDLIDMPVSKAVRYIRGPKGTTVTLLILRKTPDGQKRLTIAIVRDKIELKASEAKGEILQVGKRKLGVVRLPKFYTDYNCRNQRTLECSGTAKDVKLQIESLVAQGAEGIILDLRNNGGGDLRESILLTGMFIPQGAVVQTVDRRRVTRALQDTDGKTTYNGPLLVYVNKFSASASEIVAGALQDYGRALIVGDEYTYGKATVQIVKEIPGTEGRISNGALKVTQSKFYRPSGRSNQKEGVHPDIVIPSVMSATEIGERKNLYALSGDRIKPTEGFDPFWDFSQILPDLRKRSDQRILESKKFQELSERIQKLTEQQEAQHISLLDRKDEEETEPSESEETKKKDDPEDLERAFSPDDFSLQEAAMILLDAIDLQGQGIAWLATQN